jgi:hypothetical protein
LHLPKLLQVLRLGLLALLLRLLLRRLRLLRRSRLLGLWLLLLRLRLRHRGRQSPHSDGNAGAQQERIRFLGHDHHLRSA